MIDNMATKLPEFQRSVIEDLESGIYKWSLEYANEKCIIKNWTNPLFRQVYIDKVRSIMANINKTSYVNNTRLYKRVVEEKELPASEVAFMKAEHMFPERWHDILDIKIKRDQNLGEIQRTAMTDQFKCSRCKKRECVYYERQIRSADEPSTIFIQCLNCNNSWKI